MSNYELKSGEWGSVIFYKTAGMLKLQSIKTVAQNRSLSKGLVQEIYLQP